MAAARVCDEGHASDGYGRVDQGEQGHCVSRLVQHVRGQDGIELPEPGRRRSVPVDERSLEIQPVGRCVCGDQRQRLRSPVRRNHVGPDERRSERREREATAELEHARTREVEPCDVAGEGDTARPEVGPVGEELVLLEAALVDQALGILRPREDELASADEYPLLPHPASLPAR